MPESFMETRSCRISTLSPVHVGCGEDYYPTNYVIDEGYLHHFGELQLLRALKHDELHHLAKLAENPNGQQAIQGLQGVIYALRERLIPFATHGVPVSEALQRFYQSRVGHVAQQESGGRRISHNLEIQRNSFNPHTQQPYIPGSSIKGAIRTAILDRLNGGKRNPDSEKTQALQKRLLGYGKVTEDPLRLLKVGDAPYRHPDGLNGLEIRFAVNRKKQRSKRKSMAEEKGLNTLLECLCANRIRSFATELALLHDKALAEWQRKLPFRSLEELAGICNDFYRPQLQEDLAMLEDLNYADPRWRNGLKKLAQGELGRALDAGKAILLRVGKHSGAESNTLNGVRRIKIMQGKGKQAKPLDHATTTWLAAAHKDQQTDLLPFGWIVMELGDAELKEIQAFLRANAQPAYDRQSEEREREQRAQHLRAERERAEVEARRREEEEATLAAARAARRAAQTPQQQIIEDLREMLEKKRASGLREQVGGALYTEMRGKIEQAGGWPAEDRAALKQVCKAIVEWLGAAKNAKAKELLRKLD